MTIPFPPNPAVSLGPPRKSFVMQRLKPALALGAGLFVLLFNAILIIASDQFVVFGVYLGCAITSAASFGVVVGEPQDIYGYRPMWFKVGLVAAVIVGLLVALMLHIEITVE